MAGLEGIRAKIGLAIEHNLLPAAGVHRAEVLDAELVAMPPWIF